MIPLFFSKLQEQSVNSDNSLFFTVMTNALSPISYVGSVEMILWEMKNFSINISVKPTL